MVVSSDARARAASKAAVAFPLPGQKQSSVRKHKKDFGPVSVTVN